MRFDLYINYLIMLILLVFSWIFSGSETAFFSLNHLEKERLKQKARGKMKKFILTVLDAPEQLLITILTGNMIVNLFFASLMDQVVESYAGENAWIYSILLGTVFILIFGEMFPKNIGVKNSLTLFNFLSPLLNFLHFFFSPVRKVLSALERKIIMLASKSLKTDDEDNREMVSSTLRLGLKRGLIQHSELSVLETFFDFREKTVEDIMIPRTEIKGYEAGTDIDELFKWGDIKKNIKANRLLIPVYKKDIDHISGYINIQNLLPYVCHPKKYNLNLIIEPVHPVPQSKNLLTLLSELMEKKRGMALIIDEYGGTAGIITLQDLVEDFLRFFYPEQEAAFSKISENRYRLPAAFPIEKLSGLLDLEIKTDSRTIGGFLTEGLGEIPAPGKTLSFDRYEFIVKRVSKNKILEVEVHKK